MYRGYTDPDENVLRVRRVRRPRRLPLMARHGDETFEEYAARLAPHGIIVTWSDAPMALDDAMKLKLDHANARLKARHAEMARDFPALHTALFDMLNAWDTAQSKAGDNGPTPAEDTALWNAIVRAEGATVVDLGAVEPLPNADAGDAAWEANMRADVEAEVEVAWDAKLLAEEGPDVLTNQAVWCAVYGLTGTGEVAAYLAAWLAQSCRVEPNW